MSAHTKEPWKLNDLTCAITAQEGKEIIVSEQDPALTIHNAARIVATVNGCTGLNPAAFREVVEALKDILVRATRIQESKAVVGIEAHFIERIATQALDLAEAQG